MKLIVKLLAGIVLGILVGLVAPDFMMRIFVTAKIVFGDLIGFVIPFIIIFFIAGAIVDLGRKAGRVIGVCIGVSYISTIIAAFFAFFISAYAMGYLSVEVASVTAETGSIKPFLDIEIEPIMGIMAALLLAFLVGIGVTHIQGTSLKTTIQEGRSIVELVLEKVIVPLLPVYIFTIFAELASEGVIFPVLEVFAIILLLVLAMHIIFLLGIYTVAGLMTGCNPLVLLKTMLPAYFTALGTMSSAAAIPVTLKCTKDNKVRDEIADFTVPLCSTIHLAGSIITITTCAVAVTALTTSLGVPTFAQMLPVMLLLGLVMIAAPGVPGGAVMAALGVLIPTLGFNEAAIGLMVVLYMAQDSFGTATNVTGNGAISIIIDKLTIKDRQSGEHA